MGAVDHNPPNAQIHITNHASDFAWSIFAVMTVSMLGMFAWSYTVSMPALKKPITEQQILSAPPRHSFLS